MTARKRKGLLQAVFDVFSLSPPIAKTTETTRKNPLPVDRVSATGVAYRLVRCKRSSIGLVVSTQGLVIRAPRWSPIYEIDAAIAERATWIAEALSRQREKLSALTELREGGHLLFRGKKLKIEVQSGLFDHVDLSENACIVTSRSGALDETLLDHALMQIAKTELPVLATQMATAANLPLRDVAISKARTMWGSCTVDRRVRLNFRLVQLPPALCAHVVAHELAHLVEFNHSRRFWAIVRQLDPESARHRRAVNKYSVLLEL
jgi:predicted metal-dependent hydrolase